MSPVVQLSRPRGNGVPPGDGMVRPASAGLSLFHADWWLDAVAPGRWEEVSVEEQDASAIWRFALERRVGGLVSELPPFTRLLGPALWLPPGQETHRVVARLVAALAGKIPKTRYFETGLAADWGDMVALQRLGFSLEVHQTLVLDPVGRDRLWAGLSQSRRSNIRRAEKRFEVTPVDDPEWFVWFYLDCLRRRGLKSGVALKGLPKLYEACMSRGQGEILATRNEAGEIGSATFTAWGRGRAYQLLWARHPTSDMSSSLLTWWNLLRASDRGLTFDFDGVTQASRLDFISGYGGRAENRFFARRGLALHRLRRRLRALVLALYRNEPDFGG